MVQGVTIIVRARARDEQWAGRVAEVLQKHLRKRVGASARVVSERAPARARAGASGATIVLQEAEVEGGEEAYAITNAPASSRAGKPVITISGRSRGLPYGVGRLLREVQRGGGGGGGKGAKSGKVIWPKLNVGAAEGSEGTPALAVRGIYFPTTLDPTDETKPPRPFNSYNVWLAEEGRFQDFEDYLIEMMLWGMNTVGMWYAEWMDAPWDDTDSGRITGNVYRRVAEMARSWGMKLWLVLSPNLVPRAYHAAHRQHHCDTIPRGLWGQFPVPSTLCPSVPEVNRFVMDYNRRLIEMFKPDWIELFPTDPGGCDCEKCLPWWKTYWKLALELIGPYKDTIPMRSINLWYFWNRDAKKLAALVAKTDIINTVCTQNAWQEQTSERLKITDALAKKGKKIIFWPDITMAGGWGTWGTYPMPKTLHALLNLPGTVHGVLPYTEGRYDDINKFIMLSLAWNPKQPPPPLRALVKKTLEGMHNQAMPTEAVDGVLAVEARDFTKAQKKLAAAAAKLDKKTTGDWRWYSLDYYARHGGIADQGAKLVAELKKAKEAGGARARARAKPQALAKWSSQFKALHADLCAAGREMPALYRKVNDFRNNYDMFCGVKLRDEADLMKQTSLEQAQTLLGELRGEKGRSTTAPDRATTMNLHASGKKKSR